MAGSAVDPEARSPRALTGATVEAVEAGRLTWPAVLGIVRGVTSHERRNGGEMRRILVVVVVAAMGAVFVPLGVAGKPEQARVEPGTVLAVYPAGLVCSESDAPGGVRWTFVGGPTTDRLFDNGRFMESGNGAIEVTNIASGESVVIPLHGSIVQIPTDTGFTAHTGGAVLVSLFPGDAGPGDVSTGRMYVITGHIVAEVDSIGAGGAFSSFAYTGQLVDVCAMIA